jgi:hypothetical protein
MQSTKKTTRITSIAKKNKINSKKEFEKRNHIYFRLILDVTPFYSLCYTLLFYSSPLLMTMALLVIVVIVNTRTSCCHCCCCCLLSVMLES